MSTPRPFCMGFPFPLPLGLMACGICKVKPMTKLINVYRTLKISHLILNFERNVLGPIPKRNSSYLYTERIEIVQGKLLRASWCSRSQTKIWAIETVEQKVLRVEK